MVSDHKNQTMAVNDGLYSFTQISCLMTGGGTPDPVSFFSYLNVSQDFNPSPGTYSCDHSSYLLYAGNNIIEKVHVGLKS